MAMHYVNEGPFDRFGGRFREIINPRHFLGRSSFDIPWSESFPPANVRRDEEAFHIELLVPGFSKDELQVTVERGVLIVRGIKKEKAPVDQSEFVCEEFAVESFERRFRLTHEHSEDQIEAFLENGILRIVFYEKKVPVAAEYKRIQVTEN
jgi:HSP20 family protein